MRQITAAAEPSEARDYRVSLPNQRYTPLISLGASGNLAVIMNVLEVAVFAMVVLGPHQQPFTCEVSIGGVRCSHGIAAFRDGVNDILMSDGTKVAKSPKGELLFSNGIQARMDSLGWVQFSNGVAVRREGTEQFRFSTGMLCRYTAVGRVNCARE